MLFDNLMPRLTDMPLLAPDHTNLGALLAQARELENQQEAARAHLRAVNQQRRQMLKQAGLAPSTSEALRNIEQGGVKIDGAHIERVLPMQDGKFIVTRIRDSLGYKPI